MFVVPHVNATEEQLWRWFRCKGPDGQHADVELRLITTEELTSARKDDAALFRVFIAAKWFRNFRNIADVNRIEIPNTEANRASILLDTVVWNFVQLKLISSSNWREEGKDDSGSAS